MPTGSYDVQVSLKSDGSTHVMPQISGRITFPDSHAIGSELKRLAKHAIVLPASADDIGLSSATQSSHGLDLTAILESTAQTELVSSFPVDNAQFEKACTMLRTKEMKWALCEILNHPNACLLYTSPSPRDREKSRMPSSA